MELKEYYEQAAKSLDDGDTTPAEVYPRAFNAATKEQSPRQRLKQLQQLSHNLEADRRQLSDLMDKASVKEGEAADSPIRLQALAELLAEFPQKIANLVKFKLTDPLLDKQGNKVKEVAMKKLDAQNPEHAAAQFRILEEQFEKVQKYNPDIELRLIHDKDNSPIAVVIGINAEEFNALVTAEKTLEKFRQREAQITKEVADAREALEKEAKLKQGEQVAATNVEKVSAPSTSKTLALH